MKVRFKKNYQGKIKNYKKGAIVEHMVDSLAFDLYQRGIIEIMDKKYYYLKEE